MPHALPDPDYDPAFYDGIPAKRLFAWVADVILLTLTTFILGLLTLSLVWWLWVPVYLTLSFLYRAMTIAGSSATLGMRLMNIQLRGATGQVFSPGEAVFHTLAYLVASGFGVLQLISIVMIAMGRRHQSLPDLLLGSAMINRPQ